ncbi:uncharacterized protein F4807DRAFT_468623 [Annulohypoxylon truncatum]|uniref:uncharacterized protein n=1 Tax=Annulohypoxylon truncatum TaxID=327061 RepID=UPI002008594A|nr:uncharacterized protein F4807DRAFT_468623 [Annulohypoxylon truncatum]KAI1208367.1 hypothetical protein F4807DRAFT_468623 [Annulohypoxylon truncatum]
MRLAVRGYISQRLPSLQEKFNQLHLNSGEVEDIGDEITKKSDGMFLYARLVLNYLENKIFYKGSEVKLSVNELPKELSDFYRKILTQILVRLDAQSVHRVRSIFCWIAFARRPLKKIEFLSAISFSAGDPDITHLVPTYILDICGALIEERRDNTLAFIHISVKEFLQSSSSGLAIDKKEVIVEHAHQDGRLVSLQNPLLRKELELALWTRSPKGLESGLQTNRLSNHSIPSTSLPPQDGISFMLAAYEESVKFLLSQNDYPGVSTEELESFKSQFRGSAFTCRLSSCPRATLGFESEVLRVDHEMTHLPRLQCDFPGCQNPPFVSVQALRNHVKKYHVAQPARKSIRQVADASQITFENAAEQLVNRANQIRNSGNTSQIDSPRLMSGSIEERTR